MNQIPSLHSISLLLLLILFSCQSSPQIQPSECPAVVGASPEVGRSFSMGFTTWQFGPELADQRDTYAFLDQEADIYAEHLDHRIPWQAWITGEELPDAFTDEIQGKVNRRLPTHRLLLSVSVLNMGRSDLLEDMDGQPPAYDRMDDPHIEKAYFLHLSHLIEQFQPDDLVLSIEANELRINNPDRWPEYQNLIQAVRSRLKQSYPELPMAESFTLHNWLAPEVEDEAEYLADMQAHLQEQDFLAVSFYPYFKGLHDQEDFQRAFDFLHQQTELPIAFVETSHLAENLRIPDLNVDIASDICEQQAYLATLLDNAQRHEYQFVIWWAHRDFDALWATFPEEVKDLGQIWRDTGLLDEGGGERPAMEVWRNWLER
ncbi:MAG: hypothetical protein AAF399_21690 [Bacteroidota bacterium]